MVIQSSNICFLIIGPMRPLKSLPLALACLLFLPTFAEAAATKQADSPISKLIKANLKSCAKPVWPIESLERGEEGSVILAFLISLDGRVLESKVEKSSGHPSLDLAAQDGLAKCLFSSPETIGRHEPTWTKMNYVWVLEESETPAQVAAKLERDKALAVEGDAEAIYNMSTRYFFGYASTPKNIPESLRLLRKSAELGFAPAQSALAMVLFSGKDAEKDVAQAIGWGKKAAAQGSPIAQASLALILMNAPEELADNELLFDVLEKAVAQENVDAKFLLGSLLLEATEDERPRGLQLLIDAAEAKHWIAQHDLARIYELGDLLPKDLAKAKALYERSAAAGFEPAKDALLRLP